MFLTWLPHQRTSRISEHAFAGSLTSHLERSQQADSRMGLCTSLVAHGDPVTTRVGVVMQKARRWDLWAEDAVYVLAPKYTQARMDHDRVIPVCGENHYEMTELPLAQSQLHVLSTQ